MKAVAADVDELPGRRDGSRSGLARFRHVADRVVQPVEESRSRFDLAEFANRLAPLGDDGADPKTR